MGMGMSVSPQIWQQFIDLVFQDDLIKCKQNFDIIMDDTFIHSTAEEHMDDLIDLFKVLRKYSLKLSLHKCQFFKKKTNVMPLEILNHQRLLDKLELFVAWSTSYHLSYQIFIDYLYRYMTFKRKPKSLNGQSKLRKLLMTLNSY